MGLMSGDFTQILIPACAFIGIGFALFQWFLVSRIRVAPKGLENVKDHLIEEDEQEKGIDSVDVVNKCAEIQNAISVGAISFLFTEYKYLAIFTFAFGAIIFIFLGSVHSD